MLQEWVARPMLLSADRRVRGALAAFVILAAAGTGFLASRLWPLPISLAPTLKVVPSDAIALDHDSPTKQNDIRSASRAIGDGNVQVTESERADATEKPPGASFVLLNPGTVEQPRSVEERTQQSTANRSDGSAEQPMLPTQPAGRPRDAKMASPQVARGQKKHQAEPAQPAPSPTGYQRDTAMRDFMSHNPPFTR